MMSLPNVDGGLAGLRVMVVEDDFLLAFDYEVMLREAGCQIVGPVPREAMATALLKREQPDAVILDLNLAGHQPIALANSMIDQDVPFLIVSGYGEKAVDDEVFWNAPIIAKPASIEVVLSALAALVRRG